MKRIIRIIKSQRSGRIGATAVCLLLLVACNGGTGPFPTYVVVLPPTNTLAPILTQTPRFTATPIPSPTPIPTAGSANVSDVPTLTPEAFPSAEQPTPTLTATPFIKAVVKQSANLVNLRASPAQSARSIGSLRGGSPIQIISLNTDARWALIRLDDGTEGWMLAEFITTVNPEATIPQLSSTELTQRAQLGTAVMLTSTALVPTAEGSIAIDNAAPTRSARLDTRTDVLAYCDQRKDAAKNKEFKPGSKVYVFWSWIARTPEQMKDHLNSAVYNVRINDQLIGDWAKFSTPVTKQSDGSYITYWFVPMAALTAGSYKIEFSVTWKTPIYDGDANFGPGTDKPSETGTCSFRISAK